MLIRTNRRRFLRGLGLGAGAALLTPIASSLIRSAQGATDGPKRFIMFGHNAGLDDEHKPTMLGSPEEFSLGGFSPLEPYRDEILWVEEMYNPFALDLHGNDWSWTAQQVVSQGDDILPGGPSIDRFIAQAIGQGDPLSSLSLAITRGNQFRGGESASGSGEPFPAHDNPVTAFESTLGSLVDEGGPSLEERLARELSVLDRMTDDVTRLSGRLAGPERAKLDQYLDSIRGIEHKIETLAAISCDGLEPPPASAGEQLKERREEIIDAMIDIAVNAMICGVTRVTALQMSGLGDLPFLGAGVGGHTMWHGDGTPQTFATYFGYVAELMKRVWERLALVPEGSGDMTDNTVLVYFGKNGRKHHNGSYTLQAMVLGDAGGALRSGRYVELPQSEMTADDPRAEPQPGDGEKRAPGEGTLAPVHCVSDLFVTLAQAVGVDAQTFGSPDHCQGPLAQLLA